jgi:hypothetical protein
MSELERITSGDDVLALVVRASHRPAATTFLTDPEHVQQVGFVVYGRGGEVARHAHLPVERRIVGTPEVIVVRAGRCELDVFDDRRELVATRELREGDVMVMLGGGHGFRMLEDTVLLEVKQGPYGGEAEKERF